MESLLRAVECRNCRSISDSKLAGNQTERRKEPGLVSPGMGGVKRGWKLWIGLREGIGRGGLLHVSASLCELSDNKLLGQTGAHSFRRADREISEHPTRAAIDFRIVQIGKCRGCKVAADAGVVGLPFSAVTPCNEWAEQRMSDP